MGRRIRRNRPASGRSTPPSSIEPSLRWPGFVDCIVHGRRTVDTDHSFRSALGDGHLPLHRYRGLDPALGARRRERCGSRSSGTTPSSPRPSVPTAGTTSRRSGMPSRPPSRTPPPRSPPASTPSAPSMPNRGPRQDHCACAWRCIAGRPSHRQRAITWRRVLNRLARSCRPGTGDKCSSRRRCGRQSASGFRMASPLSRSASTGCATCWKRRRSGSSPSRGCPRRSHR